ncbi:MAG: TadE/TadG family type IV pilus assembly protein [Egibacteraceae bacterium]
MIRQRLTGEDSDRGAAALEFALVLPLLLLLIFGTVDFAMAYQRHVTLAHAAREGVRAWALSDPDAPTDPTPTTQGAASGLPAASVTVACATALIPGGPWAPVACSDPCLTGTPARVTAQYDYTFITPVASFMGMFGATPSDTIALRGQGVMRCGG